MELDTHEVSERIVAPNCGKCGKTFQAVALLFENRTVFVPKECDLCRNASERRRAIEEAKQKSEDDRVEWNKLCQKEFRTLGEGGNTDPVLLEKLQPKIAEIIRHPLAMNGTRGGKGLILRGPTGSGKTRCMFRLLRTYFDLDPRPGIIAMTAGEFDRQARDAQWDRKLTEWFDNLASVRVLFLDDLGKGSWSEKTSSQFWNLVDERVRNGKPLFATTNYGGEELCRAIGMDGDTGPSLVRRLRDYCDRITLSECPRNTEDRR